MMQLIIFLAISLFCNPVFASVEFDATDDYINIGDKLYSDTLSGCAWVNPRSYSSGIKGVIVKRNNNAEPPTSAGNEYYFFIGTSGTVCFQAWDSGGSTTILDFCSSGTISTGQWSHICFTMASGASGAAKIYVNGAQDGSATKTNTVGNQTSHIQLGSRSGNNNFRWFDGQISDVAIWNIDISALTIQLIASSRTRYTPMQFNTSNIKMYLPLDDGNDGTTSCFDGTTGFKDKTANRNNGSGVDGSNNSGLICKGDRLTYP